MPLGAERKSREFYTGAGQKVTGFECPGTPRYWWVPEVGMSMAEGYSLFGTKRESLVHEREVLQREIAAAQSKLAKVEAALAQSEGKGEKR